MSSIVRSVVVDLPQGPTQHPGVASSMSRFTLWFNRDLPVPTVPEALRPFVKGRQYLSTKQVPSATILRCAGSASVKKSRDILLRAGFTLREEDSADREYARDLTVKRTLGGLPVPSGSLASILTEAQDLANITAEADDDSMSVSSLSGEETDPVEEGLTEAPSTAVRFRKTSRFRIRYSDPWKIHAGCVLGEILGEVPDIIVWSGDGIRLQDPLPVWLLGPSWDGKGKGRVRLPSIANDKVIHHVIYTHTHWGKALVKMCNDQEAPWRSWACTLRRRINRFLAGKTDPIMSNNQLQSIFVDHTVVRSKKARIERFIELLKTVDGIFTQRYLCYPEEVWTWERFDTFTLGNISSLLGDEFLDGELAEAALTIDTAYSQLKRSRKWYKMHAHRGDLAQAVLDLSEIPKWCLQFANVWKRSATATGYRKIYLVGILSQTRGCGTPPPLVVLQSKLKFLTTISADPIEDNSTLRALRKACLDEIISMIPDEAFTGLSTKARVTVTTSACWESTRRTGGTCEEVRRIIASQEAGDQIPIRDLNTGEIKTWGDASTLGSTGEYIFWSCLDQVLRTPPVLLNEAFLTVVKEPGKARTVTKARACLKVVLDLVNKICSEPLAKGVRSSHSGMSRANHGWNLFNRLMSDEMKGEVFALESRVENPYEGYTERVDTFEDFYIGSTDYEEATDRLQHYVADELGTAWMLKCGIPPVLRGIVRRTCFRPRTVYFQATGLLANVGQAAPHYGENIRSVVLRTGILMGDPLTKIVLHLTNISARHLGARMHDSDFYDVFRNGRTAHETFLQSEHGGEHSTNHPS